MASAKLLRTSGTAGTDDTKFYDLLVFRANADNPQAARLLCPTDEAATETARRVGRDVALVEVWHTCRLVGLVFPKALRHPAVEFRDAA